MADSSSDFSHFQGTKPKKIKKKHAAEAEDLPHYEVKSKTLKISSRSISKQAVVIPSFLACFGYRIRMNEW
jgi:hypothetical protein